MATKIRKQIYLDFDQEATLKRLSAALGLPESELIRQAINRHITGVQQPRRDLAAWIEERAYIASLIATERSEGARTWRREDLYDR